MLLIRHSIGSRLFFKTDEYEIQLQGDTWIISIAMSEGKAKDILKFKEELNLFDVEENQKTWYYSSDANVKFDQSQLMITADHKTVYPI